MQHRFGVTVRLHATFEHQIARRLERDAVIEITGHGRVSRVAGILIALVAGIDRI